MKLKFIIGTILVCISACKKQQSELQINAIPTEEKFGEEELNICKEQSENGITFETCLKKYYLFTLKSSKGDVLYKNDNNPSDYKFIDFNEDGFLDIQLHFMTNVPGVNEILIFNPKSKSFIEIENFSNFPSTIKIKATDFYYSYERNGCADNNWNSDLFKIIDNKAIRFGNIEGIGCEGFKKTGIYINKVNIDEITKIKFIAREEGYWDGKWDFIEKYWNENYNKFE
ncbi:hypothetical protein FIA58_004095 [Flavobacterium jejuense]|uniref:VCBS repeat-containing protein n=1 Tax=Flavobacterium jejuense TaxID=1544455 RepID=A0ABX0IRU9_9FLAO|nr:hypothetical protein [Flavobacterium jejuense]NHN24851.1 hypothetical protein [Flavobacterium jejuense]